MAENVTVTISARRRWFFGALLDALMVLAFFNIISSDAAATIAVKLGMKIGVET